MHPIPARRRFVSHRVRRRIWRPGGAHELCRVVIWPVVAPASAHRHPD